MIAVIGRPGNPGAFFLLEVGRKRSAFRAFHLDHADDFLDAHGAVGLAVRVEDDPHVRIGRIQRGAQPAGQIHVLVRHADQRDPACPARPPVV